MSLLNHLRGYRGPEAATLDEYFDRAKQEAWNRMCDAARGNARIVDDAAIEVAVRRRAEAPGSFFALLIYIAAKDAERRDAMIALFRKHLPEHPGRALAAAGYNLHEFHRLLDRQWIADARAHFDADPEGAWGILESAAMYERHCVSPEDVDWFEARRATLPRDYYVVMLSLGHVERALAHFDEAPAAAVEAAAFKGYEHATPELIVGMAGAGE